MKRTFVLTQKLMTLAALLMIGSTAFADEQGLKIFNTMLNAGAETEQFMSQAHMGLNDVSCVYSVHSKELSCTMYDIAAKDGQGAEVDVEGKPAEELYQLLIDIGAPMDNGMGLAIIGAQSIRCTQAVEGVMDDDATPADRTNCDVGFEAQ